MSGRAGRPSGAGSATVSDAGHNYRFGPPSKGWPEFDDEGKVIVDTTNASHHKYVPLTKVYAKPPRRVWFKGTCACGWEHPNWHLDPEKAKDDFNNVHGNLVGVAA